MDAWCCDTDWDAQCVDEVGSICGMPCPAPVCGDGVIAGTETCDGADLAGEDCVTQGFLGGVLACLGDCSGFDTTGCIAPACDHPLCDEGVLLDPACDPCVAQICAVDPWCCDTDWDAQCVDEVGSICGMPCP
jgi:hypothetical protein